MGIGTLAKACLVLGELDRLARLLDPGTDGTGLLLERDALPSRIARRRAPKGASSTPGGKASPDDEDGVGF